ncbi:ATP-grasp fold amidoligase family protein [Arthrobacter sp. MDT1-48-3]
MVSSNTFLSLMRARFDRKNDELIDPVPWVLDDKDTAYSYVQKAGYAVPRYEKVSSAMEALAVGERFGGRFVVKQPNRHSTMGIYILESLGDGRFLDLFSMSELTSAQVKSVPPEPDYWLAEECLPSTVAGRPLPFDYKVYAFKGAVSHVVQIDRNVYPPRIAVFDGAFIPLQPGKDYSTDPSRWKHENHVLPKHAGAILEMASTLSAGLDTRFVRVDCYDGPDGPVFGEFTFASGPDDIGMLRYSPAIHAALDKAMQTGRVPALSGFDIDMKAFRDALTKDPTFVSDNLVLSRLSAGAVQGDTRYATKLLTHLKGPNRNAFTLAINLVGWLNGDQSRAFGIQQVLRGRNKILVGDSRLKEFEEAALQFHDARAKGNAWHTARAAEVRLASGDRSALNVIRSLADDGYQHAAKVLANHVATSTV